VLTNYFILFRRRYIKILIDWGRGGGGGGGVGKAKRQPTTSCASRLRTIYQSTSTFIYSTRFSCRSLIVSACGYTHTVQI